MNCYSGIETMPVTRLKYIPLNQKHSSRNQKSPSANMTELSNFKVHKAVSSIQNSIEVKRERAQSIYLHIKSVE